MSNTILLLHFFITLIIFLSRVQWHCHKTNEPIWLPLRQSRLLIPFCRYFCIIFIFLACFYSSHVSNFLFQASVLCRLVCCWTLFTITQSCQFPKRSDPSLFFHNSSWFIANDNPVEGQRCSQIIHLMESCYISAPCSSVASAATLEVVQSVLTVCGWFWAC